MCPDRQRVCRGLSAAEHRQVRRSPLGCGPDPSNRKGLAARAQTQLSGTHSASSWSSGQGTPWLAGCTRM